MIELVWTNVGHNCLVAAATLPEDSYTFTVMKNLYTDYLDLIIYKHKLGYLNLIDRFHTLEACEAYIYKVLV